MDRVWITNGSTRVAPVVNSLHAACHRGFVPDEVYLLDNPGIADVTPRVETMVEAIVTAHGGDTPAFEVTSLEDETDFGGIVDFIASTVRSAEANDAEVAVDVTPGRKFWSFIAFQSGVTHDADHLYYLHVRTEDYFGASYAAIPRTAADLIDFTEVI
ncbi:MAG: hypothetical protein ACLFMX_04275 [Halobacteriales archaeon]